MTQAEQLLIVNRNYSRSKLITPKTDFYDVVDDWISNVNFNIPNYTEIQAQDKGSGQAPWTSQNRTDQTGHAMREMYRAAMEAQKK